VVGDNVSIKWFEGGVCSHRSFNCSRRELGGGHWRMTPFSLYLCPTGAASKKRGAHGGENWG